jgi:glycine oxidase
MSEKDFIIVGQGLAGTVVALTLQKYKKSFVLLDRPNAKSSSNIAAGILNPISFKRCIHSWKANILNPYSLSFYEEMNKKLNEKNFIPLDVIRIFSSFEEQNNWLSKTGDLRYNLFLGDDKVKFQKTNFNLPFGFGSVKSCGRLIVKDFINASYSYFKNSSSVFKSFERINAIPKINGWYNYGGFKAKNIIYCEGVDLINNPLFNYLPIVPNKGELLKINSLSLPQKLISKGIFILPEAQKSNFTIGSTYDHEDRSYEPTEIAKENLLSKFNTIGDFKYNIINQEVGFRPTTKDRRPIIGEHPVLKKSYVLNGLGSKGVMSAPWLANNLIRHILLGDEIDKEIDIIRHEKKMSKENSSFASNLCNS